MFKENIPLHKDEEVKLIVDYEGLYSITSFGRVWSHCRLVKSKEYLYRKCGENFLQGYKDKEGYLLVKLSKNNRKHTYKIHRLVAQHYIPNPQNLPEVNHKDGNKKNNHKDNLEWCTSQGNSNHLVRNNLKGRKSKYFGVCYFSSTKGKKKWISYVFKEGKQKNIKYSYTELEAAKAYNEYVIKHNLNRPLNIINEEKKGGK